jgi:hypothetical protein
MTLRFLFGERLGGEKDSEFSPFKSRLARQS